jgi:hypothetical protein
LIKSENTANRNDRRDAVLARCDQDCLTSVALYRSGNREQADSDAKLHHQTALRISQQEKARKHSRNLL